MKKFFIILILIIVSCLCCEYKTQSLEEIKVRAASGDAYQQAKLAELYIRGSEEVEQNIEAALPWLQKSYEQGHPFAAYLLGYLALTGVSQEKSHIEYFQEAFPELKEMSEEGNAEAMLKLSAFYRYGWATTPDYSKANEVMEKAAEAGIPRANYLLGYSYLTGQFTEKKFGLAYKHLSRVAKSNNAAQYQVANMLLNGNGVKADPDKALDILQELQTSKTSAENVQQEGDTIIPDLLPPTYSLAIEEGSCGENVMWTILDRIGRTKTQYENNYAGGDPGRGLHSDEMFIAMDSLQIPYQEISEMFRSSDKTFISEKYHDFLYDKIIPRILSEIPVMIGIKVLPTQFPEWAYDHFILLVGYNENTDELIYNDFNNRRRLPAAKLLNEDPGYSFINDWNIVFAVTFPEL